MKKPVRINVAINLSLLDIISYFLFFLKTLIMAISLRSLVVPIKKIETISTIKMKPIIRKAIDPIVANRASVE
ncbi:hypothetical protein KAX35_08415 [candidate division WOR-3 bacterium]|nr:hypothetical protein [candidate division WOR-3 bacterium]